MKKDEEKTKFIIEMLKAGMTTGEIQRILRSGTIAATIDRIASENKIPREKNKVNDRDINAIRALLESWINDAANASSIINGEKVDILINSLENLKWCSDGRQRYITQLQRSREPMRLKERHDYKKNRQKELEDNER